MTLSLLALALASRTYQVCQTVPISREKCQDSDRLLLVVVDRVGLIRTRFLEMTVISGDMGDSSVSRYSCLEMTV